jgi:carbamoyl-phosphate synthase small subunit
VEKSLSIGLAEKKFMATKAKKAKSGGLLLEDGSFWKGTSFGSSSTTVGEAVFHTALSGYQEILTDPSYRKQIITFSAVQIGNQGFHSEDFESKQIWASGCLVRDYSEPLYHWRKEKSLDEVLKENKCPALSGIDTRRLILRIREKGSLWGVLSTETDDVKALKKHLGKKLSMEGLSLTKEVSTKSPYTWTEGSVPLLNTESPDAQKSKRVVVMDFGAKHQILRYLIDSGFKEAVVVPSQTSAKDILALKPDALFLSNGPGDPAAEKEAVAEVKKLIGELPILGICLGHQILGLALGLPTFKLKFGHHGANHPVKNLRTDKVEITSQNHGFAVSSEAAAKSKDIEVTHINLNDQTVEGFVHKKYPICAIQFHPESSPGPIDSTSTFKRFYEGKFI